MAACSNPVWRMLVKRTLQLFRVVWPLAVMMPCQKRSFASSLTEALILSERALHLKVDWSLTTKTVSQAVGL